jgi:hypothetical protein
MPNRAHFYADGLRWIGSLFDGAASRLERNAEELAGIDPRARREADEYLNDVRSRAHLHG